MVENMKEELLEFIEREEMDKKDLMTFWVIGALERLRTWGLLKGHFSKEVSEKGNLVWLALDDHRTEIFQRGGDKLAHAFTLGLLVNEGFKPEDVITTEIANLVRDFYSDGGRYLLLSKVMASRLQ